MNAELMRQCYDEDISKGQLRLHRADVLKLIVYAGEMNHRRAAVLSNTASATLGRSHGLDRYVITNLSHEGPVSSDMVATAVEAVVGAAYKDGGIDAVRVMMAFLDLRP